MRPRSSTKKRPPEPVFFIDRDLGPIFVAVLRMSHLRVESIADHFDSPSTPDTEWLRFVAEKKWVAVTHDQLRAEPEEQEILMLHGVKVFVLVGRATHAEMARCFLQNIRKVKKLVATHDEPFLAKVYVARNEVRIALTLGDWLARQARRRR